MLDISISVLVAVLTLATAYLGAHVTMHPAETAREKRLYKIAFAGCGLTACVLIGFQTWRNNNTQNALMARFSQIEKNTNQPPRVTVNVPPSPPTQIIVNHTSPFHGSLSLAKIEFPPALDADPFAVNVYLRNVGQGPLPEVYFWEIATFQPIGQLKSQSDSNAADRKAYTAFLKLGKEEVKKSKRAGHAPTYFAAGEDHWGTMFLHPGQEEINGVMLGSTRLYFFAYAEWDGGSSQYASCRWLQPPTDMHYGNGVNLILHDCVW